MNPLEIAQAQALAKKKAQEQSKIQFFLDYLRRQMQSNQQPQQQTSPAAGYISKDYTRNRLDQAGDY